jgi:hypothetical protein
MMMMMTDVGDDEDDDDDGDDDDDHRCCRPLRTRGCWCPPSFAAPSLARYARAIHQLTEMWKYLNKYVSKKRRWCLYTCISRFLPHAHT